MPTLSPEEGIAIGASTHSQDFHFQEMLWAIPAGKLAYSVIEKAAGTYLERMSELWKEMNQCGRASACPEVKLPSKRKRDLERSKCFFIGYCICHNWRLREFVTRVQQFLRRSCPKKSTNQNLVKSGMFVVRIYQPLVDEDQPAFWYHIAYANCKTWVAAVIPLQRTADPIREVLARSAGRIALDLAEAEEARLGVNHWWHHFWNLDFSVAYHMQLYVLRDDDLEIKTAFIPAEIEVRSAIPTAISDIWKGNAEERPQPKRRQGSRSTQRRRAPAGPAPSSSAEQPPKPQSDDGSAAGGSEGSAGSVRSGERSDMDSVHSWQAEQNSDLETDDTPGASSVASVGSEKALPSVLIIFAHCRFIDVHSSLVIIWPVSHLFFCVPTYAACVFHIA